MRTETTDYKDFYFRNKDFIDPIRERVRKETNEAIARAEALRQSVPSDYDHDNPPESDRKIWEQR